MKLSIDTTILSKYSMCLREFLALLFPYLGIRHEEAYNSAIAKGLADADLTSSHELVLSDNTKNLVAKVLIESSDKLQQSPVKDFDALALVLQDLYPPGNKSGTTYPWRGTTGEIAQKLRTLVVLHDFSFTEEEAIRATEQYVQEFKDYKYMKLLKYFLLHTKNTEINSDFMTIIENNR